MRYNFGAYQLDDERFELRRGTTVLQVQRRVFDTIHYLIANRDRVVTRDELVAGPWGGMTVSDAALDRALMNARKILRQQQGEPDPIRTVRGRGYIWVSPVRTSDRPGPPASSLETSQVQPARALLGREEELRVLSRSLDEAMRGAGSIVVLEGAPGVGKTRLVEHFTGRATKAPVLWGHCWEGGGAPPLWPWIQIVRSYLDGNFDDNPADVPRSVARTLETLVPELREDPAQTPAVETPQTRFQVFDAIVQLLRSATRQRPVVVVLEDVHAADDPSILLLQFLTRFVSSMRLLVLVTYRDIELGSTPLLASFVSGMPTNLHKVTLRGLEEKHLATLIEEIIRAPPKDFVAALHRSTEGNPFLAEEFARLVVAERHDESKNVASALAHFRMPDRIADAIRRHLATIPLATRELLAAAAVAGRHCDTALLSQASASDTNTVMDRLSSAFRSGLVHERAEAGRFRFGHALVRETIYRDLAPSDRAELHRKVGEALERLYEGAEDLVLPELAYHFLEAASVGRVNQSIEYGLRAAERARRMSAYELAAEHYATVLQALEFRGPEVERRPLVLLMLADAQRLAGRHEQAVATYDLVAELGRALHRPALVAQAALGLADVRREATMWEPDVAARLAEALQGLDRSDSVLRARLLSCLAIAAYHARPFDERLRLSTEGLDMARRLGDREALLSALHAHHWTLFLTSRAKNAIDIAIEMETTAIAAGDPEKILDAKLWKIGDLLELGAAPAMVAEADEHARMAQQYAHPFHLWWVSLLAATRALIRADYPKARELSNRALSLGIPLHEVLAQSLFALQAVTIALDTDGGASMEPIVLAILEQVPWFTPWRATLSLIYLLTGRPEDARRELERLALDDFASISENAHAPGVLAHLTRVVVGLGDESKARALYRRFLPYDGRHCTVGTATVYWGPASYYLALLAASFHDELDARAHFEKALAETNAVGAEGFGAWVDHDYGSLLARSGDEDARARGARMVERARQFAAKTGMTVLLGRDSVQR